MVWCLIAGNLGKPSAIGPLDSSPRRSRGAAPEKERDDVQAAEAERSAFGFTCASISQVVGCLVKGTCGWGWRSSAMEF